MVTTRTNMTIIKNMLYLIMDKAAVEDGFHSPLVKYIPNKEIARFLVVNAPSITPSEVRGKFLSVQIGENIPVQRVISDDEEEMFVPHGLIDGRFNFNHRKVYDELCKG
jgi:hypothetical protein